MKRTLKVAMSVGSSFALAVLFFFLLIAPARAPSGGKLWTGGRTIASLQEEDFDRRLTRIQLCYGVKLSAEQCTLERRRVCKAMLVHEVESAVEVPGHFLKAPVEFRCEDTALARPGIDDDAVALRPNGEHAAIRDALDPLLLETSASEASQAQAKEACEFLTGCKWAMRPQTFSLRKLASCLTTPNATHRKVLLNEVGAMVFGSSRVRHHTLYSHLVGGDR
jgi:hypothetical protein